MEQNKRAEGWQIPDTGLSGRQEVRKMHRAWKLKFLVAVLLNRMLVAAKPRETSAEYLRNVMSELQSLNTPSNGEGHINVSNSFIYKTTTRNGAEEYAKRKVNNDVRQSVQNIVDYNIQRFDVTYTTTTDRSDLIPQAASQYYQVQAAVAPAPSNVHEPDVLGFTKAELAAMYKTALERGSPISLSSLTNAISSGYRPQVTGTHLELPQQQPAYQYYFFPLKTFMSELNKDNVYKATNIVPSVVTETTKGPQNQLSNPLFVAISTFVSVALLFMMGVLFLPKLGQFGDIYPREAHDDFLHLTSIITNATDLYNLINKFGSNHFNGR